MIMKISSNTSENDCNELSYDSDDNNLELSSDTENDNDFSEYLWMENQDEFDKLEMQRLEEEELMRQCIEAMLEDELEEELERLEASSNVEELCDALSSLTVPIKNIENSTLNPLAAEFVPAVSIVFPTTT